MKFEKISKCKRVVKEYSEKEIDKRINKFFIYFPYRQTLRYTYPSIYNNTKHQRKNGQLQKNQMEWYKQFEMRYRLLRRKNIDNLWALNSTYSDLKRFNARCNYTGKNKVHNPWMRISTVPLRHMLKDNLIPGWRRASW